MGVRPTQLTENRKNRLAKLFRILTCQMCRSDTHALPIHGLVKDLGHVCSIWGSYLAGWITFLYGTKTRRLVNI